MAPIVAAAACGFLFGLGLIVSGMAQPAKVLNFLDLAGRWDPSLAVVMAAALAVSSLGYALAKRRAAPLFASQSHWPAGKAIDAPLVIGAGLFGIGWGLVGLCPGPALVDLASFSPKVIGFVVAMAAGMIAHDGWRQRAPVTSVPAATPADG